MQICKEKYLLFVGGGGTTWCEKYIYRFHTLWGGVFGPKVWNFTLITTYSFFLIETFPNFLNDFLIFWSGQSHKDWRNLKKQGLFIQILLNNPISSLFPKILKLFFTPKNTPPNTRNSKLEKIPFFWGHPVGMKDHSCHNEYTPMLCVICERLLMLVMKYN